MQKCQQMAASKSPDDTAVRAAYVDRNRASWSSRESAHDTGRRASLLVAQCIRRRTVVACPFRRSQPIRGPHAERCHRLGASTRLPWSVESASSCRRADEKQTSASERVMAFEGTGAARRRRCSGADSYCNKHPEGSRTAKSALR